MENQEKNLKKFIKTIWLYNLKAKNIILLSTELIKKYKRGINGYFSFVNGFIRIF